MIREIKEREAKCGSTELSDFLGFPRVLPPEASEGRALCHLCHLALFSLVLSFFSFFPSSVPPSLFPLSFRNGGEKGKIKGLEQ